MEILYRICGAKPGALPRKGPKGPSSFLPPLATGEPSATQKRLEGCPGLSHLARRARDQAPHPGGTVDSRAGHLFPQGSFSP